MKITKLFIPGSYEDAYLYMGRLIILTEERSVRTYNLDYIVEAIEQRLPNTIPIPTMMFSRNDWLAGIQFQSLMRNKVVYQALLDAFDKFPLPNFSLDRGFPLEEQELALRDPAILDMLIYNGRLYVGATNGFYQVNIDWEKNDFAQLAQPEKKLGLRCLSTSARYGTVNASCNEAGLYTFIDDFGWWNQEKAGVKLHLADKSLRTTWMDQDIVNYPSYDHPYLFKSSFEKKTTGVEREGKVLTAVSDNSSDLNYLFGMAQQKYHIQAENVQFAYNSNHKLFVSTLEGNFFSLQLEHTNDILRLKKSTISTQNIGRALTVNPCKLGPVVETSRNVLLISDKDGQAYLLSDSGAITVRTFPRSRRFQNIVVVVHEDGLYLVSVFDETDIKGFTASTQTHLF